MHSAADDIVSACPTSKPFDFGLVSFSHVVVIKPAMAVPLFNGSSSAGHSGTIEWLRDREGHMLQQELLKYFPAPPPK